MQSILDFFLIWETAGLYKYFVSLRIHYALPLYSFNEIPSELWCHPGSSGFIIFL